MRTLALLLAAAIGMPVLAVAAPGHGSSGPHAAAQQRLLNGPRSTKIRFTLHGRTFTTTLGRLQDQRKAIRTSFAHSVAQGTTVGATLTSSSPVAVGSPGTHPTTPPNLVIKVPGLKAGVKNARNGIMAVREDTGKFANLPYDARTFCTAARATACVYLPQTQIASEDQSTIAIMDINQTPTGCSATGGSYTYQLPTPSPDEHYQLWGWCTYTYPRADATTFAAASKVYVQQTCTDPVFRRNIRAAVVSIKVKNIQVGNGDFSPHWCAIRAAVDLRAGTQHGRDVPQTRPKRT